MLLGMCTWPWLLLFSLVSGGDGFGVSVIMAISSHKTMAMFKRYNKIDLNDGREAMRKLEAHLLGDQGKEKEAQEDEFDYCNITAAIPNRIPATA